MVEGETPLESRRGYPEMYNGPPLGYHCKLCFFVKPSTYYMVNSLNPLTPKELTLAEEVIKGGFKIPSTK